MLRGRRSMTLRQVGEVRAVDRRRGLRIVFWEQRREDLATARLAVLSLELAQRRDIRHLKAALAGDVSGQEDAGRHRVVDRPGRRLAGQQDVLAGKQTWIA